jgi:TatD DNase family protein
MPDYFDIHSHLNFSQYNEDREALIQKLKDQNIFTITVGTGVETSQEAIALAEKHKNLFATVGLHPTDVFEASKSGSCNLEDFQSLAAHPKVVAIGETGLDYARLEGNAETEKQEQKKAFEAQIALALQHNKPLMIHCRDAYPDTLSILESKKKEYGEKLRGNFHFFTSPVEIAKGCLEVGFTVSFTGPITYGTMYDEVVAYVPLEKMMAETDAPFAAPVPYRGKRNEPAYVAEVVKKIAQIKGKSLDEVKKIMVKNAFELFLKNPSSRPL